MTLVTDIQNAAARLERCLDHRLTILRELERLGDEARTKRYPAEFTREIRAAITGARRSIKRDFEISLTNPRRNVSARLRFAILERDRFTCRYCGAKAPDAVLEVDHIVSVKDGGDGRPSNLVTACDDCNRGKGALSIGTESPATGEAIQ